MSGTDLLKIVMLVGIILAIMGSRWMSKHIDELRKRNRLARKCKWNMDFDKEPDGDRVKADT